MKLNQIIRQYRKEQNLTQEQLASYLGVTAPAVNKWENGNSYPDITLLAPLARILKTDVNTLLSFEEELSEQELNRIILELNDELTQKDYEQAFQKGESLILTYSSCDSLVFSVASLLFGYLGILGVKERAKYEVKIIAWYELLVKCPDTKIREHAIAALCRYYIEKEDYDKANALLDSIPPLGFDKRITEADLQIKQKNYDEAYSIYERMLCESASKAYSILLSILQLNCMQEDYVAGASTAALAKETATNYELGNYMILSPELLLAAQQKEKAKTLSLLEELLRSTQETPSQTSSKLYPHTQLANQSNLPIKEMLRSSLQTDHDLDFLRDDPRFQKLLTEFQN